MAPRARTGSLSSPRSPSLLRIFPRWYRFVADKYTGKRRKRSAPVSGPPGKSANGRNKPFSA